MGPFHFSLELVTQRQFGLPGALLLWAVHMAELASSGGVALPLDPGVPSSRGLLPLRKGEHWVG